jgi:hypothetical protein
MGTKVTATVLYECLISFDVQQQENTNAIVPITCVTDNSVTIEYVSI